MPTHRLSSATRDICLSFLLTVLLGTTLPLLLPRSIVRVAVPLVAAGGFLLAMGIALCDLLSLDKPD